MDTSSTLCSQESRASYHSVGLSTRLIAEDGQSGAKKRKPRNRRSNSRRKLKRKKRSRLKKPVSDSGKEKYLQAAFTSAQSIFNLIYLIT